MEVLRASAPHLNPETAGQFSSVLSQAYAGGLSLIPWGSGSHQNMGHPPLKTDLVLHTGKLNHVVEHSEKDLTITVESGITLGQLQKFLTPKGQFFPFWEPDAQTRTLGGILSTGSINYLAPRFGQLRDLVLGISVCQADGKLIKGGSKVVKNVSGYEMPKLFIGALGTLGIITGATLRLSPIPASTKFFKTVFPDFQAGLKAQKKLFLSKCILTFAILRQSPDETILLVRLDGTPRLVDDQARKIRDMIGSLVEIPEAEAAHSLSLKDNSVLCSGYIPPSMIGDTWGHPQECPRSALFSTDGAYHLGWNDTDLTHCKSLNRKIAAAGGWIAYKKVPENLWSDWPMWGEPRPEWKMSERLKELFDPKGILNPGRFVERNAVRH